MDHPPVPDHGAADDAPFPDHGLRKKGGHSSRRGVPDLFFIPAAGRIAGPDLVQGGAVPPGTDRLAGAAADAFIHIDQRELPALGVRHDPDGILMAGLPAGETARALVGEADHGVKLISGSGVGRFSHFCDQCFARFSAGNIIRFSGYNSCRIFCRFFVRFIVLPCPDRQTDRFLQLLSRLFPHLQDDPVNLLISDPP